MEPYDIEIDMAYLKIDEHNTHSTGNSSKRVLESSNSPFSSPIKDEECPRRSLRKKFRISNETDNRRVVSKPKKNDSMKATMKYYLDKRIKRQYPSLETIYEEPQDESLMSSRKFKRSIEFPDNVGIHKDRLKTKRRVMKAKKISIIKHLKKKVSMDLLMEKLSKIDKTDPSISSSQSVN